MRVSITVVCMVLTCLAQATAVAPPPPVGLSERVTLATHVFVGTAKDAWFIDKDGKKRDTPEPSAISGHHQIEISVQVDEALYPRAWKPRGTIRVRYIGTPEYIRENRVGKTFIYVVAVSQQSTSDATAPIFIPSYGWDPTEPMEKRKEIEALIQSRSK